MVTKTNTKKVTKRDAWNNRNLIFVLHRYNGSFCCYAEVFEDGSSVIGTPGLGLPFNTSFTVPET